MTLDGMAVKGNQKPMQRSGNPQSKEITLPFEAMAARIARRHMHDLLDGCECFGADVAAAATLAVSELVTNAVLHGDPPLALSAGWTFATMRVEVSDGREPDPVTFPTTPTLPDPYAPDGRGLAIVAALSQRHGIRARGLPGGRTGKVVWCEFDFEGGADPRRGA